MNRYVIFYYERNKHEKMCGSLLQGEQEGKDTWDSTIRGTNTERYMVFYNKENNRFKVT